MADPLESIWAGLEQKAHADKHGAERYYRALGDNAIGVRAGYKPDGGTRELLIEVPRGWSGESMIPDWKGMGHETLDLKLKPREDAYHLRLFLLANEHHDVFTTVCEDIVGSIETVTDPTTRIQEIESCLLRWRSFFERTGNRGLSSAMQQGLFAELHWLQILLHGGLDPIRAVSSWKGCARSYHDFDVGGRVVEVKSTRSKEPRHVKISNEQQLDDHGLTTLHLFVLGLLGNQEGGISLPEKVTSIRQELTGSPMGMAAFEHALISAGYLDRDENRCTERYVIRDQNLYHVVDGFPRLVNLPDGVGDLSYSVYLNACEPFSTNLDQYLEDVLEHHHGR